MSSEISASGDWDPATTTVDYTHLAQDLGLPPPTLVVASYLSILYIRFLYVSQEWPQKKRRKNVLEADGSVRYVESLACKNSPSVVGDRYLPPPLPPVSLGTNANTHLHTHTHHIDLCNLLSLNLFSAPHFFFSTGSGIEFKAFLRAQAILSSSVYPTSSNRVCVVRMGTVRPRGGPHTLQPLATLLNHAIYT